MWVKDLDDLDRERDYRERVSRDQTVRAHQPEGRKKTRTRTRIGCSGVMVAPAT
jgi:hypothetical protein